MKQATVLVVVAVLLSLAGSALAMSSTNYRLDWFTPLTGSGGPAASANYAINFTVGQAVVGASSSANYGAGLGYWYGMTQGTIPQPQHYIYLPIILLNAG